MPWHFLPAGGWLFSAASRLQCYTCCWDCELDNGFGVLTWLSVGSLSADSDSSDLYFCRVAPYCLTEGLQWCVCWLRRCGGVLVCFNDEFEKGSGCSQHLSCQPWWDGGRKWQEEWEIEECRMLVISLRYVFMVVSNWHNSSTVEERQSS